MKNCVWVKPELVVQIELGEWTPEVTCDISKLIGVRDDKHPDKVIRET